MLIVEERTLVDVKDLVCVLNTWWELWCRRIAWTQDVLTDGRVLWVDGCNVKWCAHADQIEELGSGVEVQADATRRARRIVNPSCVNAISCRLEFAPVAHGITAARLRLAAAVLLLTSDPEMALWSR